MAEAPEQGNSRLSQAQAQVGEVVDIMRVNVEKVLERDSKLSELDQRADNLQEGANQFQTQVGLITKSSPHPFKLVILNVRVILQSSLILMLTAVETMN